MIAWLAVPTLFCLLANSLQVKSHETLIFPDVSSENSSLFSTCGRGWYEFGDMCYRLGGKKKIGRLSWEKAAAHCSEKFGGHLVAIHSQELQDFLAAFISMSARGSVWIGLHDRRNETDYLWEDGSEVDYTNWEPNEPSGPSRDTEDCAEMVFYSGKNDGKSGQWNDLSCDRELQFVCQKQKGKQSRKNLDTRYCSQDAGGGWSLEESCYHLVLEKQTWDDAEEFCVKRFGGHLVTMTDFTSRLFLDYVLKSYEEDFWIGIKSKEETQQRWSSGWYVSYENWPEDVLEFADGTCTFRSEDGSWNLASCRKLLPFICESTTATAPVLKPPLEGSACPSVPGGWRDLGGEFCYFFELRNAVTWQKANFACSRRGGTLLSLHSQEEVDILVNFIRYRQPEVFIGLFRHMAHDEEFAWADHSSVDFTNWDSNEPSTEKEQCAEIRTYNMKWNDIDCEQQRGYICSVIKIIPEQTSEESYSQPCSSGYSVSVLLGIILCVLFLTSLAALVAYHFRLCDRNYERVRKHSRSTPTPTRAAELRQSYRSEMIVKEDNCDYENLA